MKKTILSILAGATMLSSVAQAAVTNIDARDLLIPTGEQKISDLYSKPEGINNSDLSKYEQAWMIIHDKKTVWKHKKFWIRTGKLFTGIDKADFADASSKDEKIEIIKKAVKENIALSALNGQLSQLEADKDSAITAGDFENAKDIIVEVEKIKEVIKEVQVAAEVDFIFTNGDILAGGKTAALLEDKKIYVQNSETGAFAKGTFRNLAGGDGYVKVAFPTAQAVMTSSSPTVFSATVYGETFTVGSVEQLTDLAKRVNEAEYVAIESHFNGVLQGEANKAITSIEVSTDGQVIATFADGTSHVAITNNNYDNGFTAGANSVSLDPVEATRTYADRVEYDNVVAEHLGAHGITTVSELNASIARGHANLDTIESYLGRDARLALEAAITGHAEAVEVYAQIGENARERTARFTQDTTFTGHSTRFSPKSSTLETISVSIRGDNGRDTIVVADIPANSLDGVSIDAIESLVTESFEYGFEAGYSAGYDDGYADGYADGFADGYSQGFADGSNQ